MRPTMRQTKADAEKEAEKTQAPVQIKELSFSNAGRAFEHPPGFDDQLTYLNARENSSKTYQKVIGATLPDGCAKSRLALGLTEKEIQPELPTGLLKFLLVGWVPQSTAAASDIPKGKHGRAVGLTRPPSGSIIRFDPADIDSLPLLAVVKVTDTEHETTTQVYVLLHQSHDVCTPYTVGADDVYYLSHFRDGTTARHNRKGNWNRLIRKFAFTPGTNVPSAKQTVLQHAQDQAKPVLPPTMSLKTGIEALIATKSRSKEPQCLDGHKTLLSAADDDLVRAPPTNTALHKFANLGTANSQPFTEAEANDVVKDLIAMVPGCEPNTEHVRALGRGLQLAELDIEYAQLHPFIFEGLFRIQEVFGSVEVDPALHDDETQTLSRIVRETHDTVQRILGHFRVPPTVSVTE